MNPSERLRFNDAIRFDQHFKEQMEKVDPSLAGIAKAFVRNIDRILQLAAMPVNVLHWALMMGAAQVKASVDLGHKPDVDLQSLDAPALDAYHAKVDEIIGIHRDSLNKSEQFVAQIWFASSANLNNLLDQESQGRLAIAAEAILQSQIGGAWTAFESLATDSWIAVVNQRPDTLGMKAWRASPGRSDDEESDVSEEDEKRDAIPLTILKDSGYDVSKSLGTIVHRGRKFKFNRLKGIRTAYGRVFDSTVKDAFPKYDELLALELTRNVIVHRGAWIDKVFLDESKELPVPSGQERDTPLKITGADAAWCVDVSTSSACSLIKYVDGWLKTKKT